jgi:RES domain-containing protein
MQRSVVERVAKVTPRTLSGVFLRHAAVNRDAFAGGHGGRWGRNFPVIYLGRPDAASVAEAYRHLVDKAGVPAGAVRPRVLYTARVTVSLMLDLTAPAALRSTGLTAADLASEVGDYAACQEVGAAAHQLGFHGVLAPAAHGIGETLALFRERITPSELPVVERETLWAHLPPDPRQPAGVRVAPRGTA